MAKAVTKSKKSKRKVLPPPELRGLPPEIRKELARWKEVTEARGRLGKAAYDHQDKQTRAVLDNIRDRLLLGSQGLIELRDSKGTSYRVKVEMPYIEHNVLFLATEILKDMALMDVRVANYQFPPTHCAECGKEISKMPTPKRKGRIK